MGFPFSESWLDLLAETDLLSSASKVLSGSDYVTQWGQRHTERAEALIVSGDINRIYDIGSYHEKLALTLESVLDEVSLQQQLRYFRQREMVRIIWRDLAGWSDLAETMRDLSALADACVQQSLKLLHRWLSADLGEPCNKLGESQQLIVLAMGKLGAGELNLSSDIDLIFTYPDDGETQGGRRSLSNEEFFTRLGRKLIQALDNVTADGFVFRVDMRLRPFGDSGALAASFASIEDYYQTQGREWERYAMIKARAVTGSESAQQKLMGLLRPFVYRRYLDYGVFDSLREMKSMIASQLHLKGMEDNIKLGAGGIREIEFIGQVFQLIYGGRDEALQQRPILTILDLLAERSFLSSDAVAELKVAYVFLRRTEHRIQAWADKQTHLLPNDEAGQLRIASAMGFTDWTAFTVNIQQYRQQVHGHFESLLAESETEATLENSVSLFNDDNAKKIADLTLLGFKDPQACVARLDALLNSHDCRHFSEIGRERLEKLLPLLVTETANVANSDECLSRLIPLLESIMRRSAYMSLLVENPAALTQLIRLCAASPLISRQLARYPVLLDELLDPRSLYSVPERKQQAALLSQAISAIDNNDLERQMILLREFRQVASLHVAAADVTGALPLMRVGDQLSELAEIELDQAFKLAWDLLVAKHGRPPCTDSDDLTKCGFTVLAYGKLGGLELGYGSDLDLVFIYDDNRNQGLTNGVRPLDTLVFYIRLAQRIISFLNTMTSSGILYEVDMRLRPNGESGLLVASVSGFADYQHNDAWTWEHQALVRARCVSGDLDLAQQVGEIRQEVLAKHRDRDIITKEVSDMRAKMRGLLDKSSGELFDIKQGVGGITDIEFMVQYAVLVWSADFPELLRYTDNIRILNTLMATDKLSEENGALLADAYRFYRKQANHCVLQEIPAVVPLAEVDQYQARVAELWQQWFV